MMPPLLTCLVGKKLCENPTQDHWTMRDYVADTITLIAKKYGDMYKSLQPRIAKTLVQAFADFSKPLPTYYGAIVGITGLGAEVIELLLLPNVEQFYKKLEAELKSEDNLRQLEGRKCLTALLVNKECVFFSQMC
jgi:transcription initiation factor TFIID subunit 6